MHTTPRLLDVVALLSDVPALGLLRGQVGTVVELLDGAYEERQYITIGTSSKQRIVFLAHVDRGEDHVRIISARPATASRKRPARP